jgi:hypothetical protein
MRRAALLGCAALALALFAAAPARAQATRTWVSGVGDDVNPCSRTAPCKTFAGAISKTAAGGEINCLDPGGFGAVTVTKSITLDCSGTLGSILASSSNGVIIAGAGIGVILRGIEINGAPPGGSQGLAGIKVLQGASLLLDDVRIYNFGGGGAPAVDIEPGLSGGGTGAFKLDIRNTTVSNNAGGAILVKPAAGWSVAASLHDVGMYTSTYGVRAEDRAKVTVFRSTASNHTNNGYLAVSTASPAEIDLVESVAANNGTNGVQANGAGATIRLAGASLVDNATGISLVSSGVVSGTTPGSTLNAGNGTNGAPNGTATALQ